MSYKNRGSGFTLPELMVAVALLGIITGFAVPEFVRLVDNSYVTSTTNSVVGLLSFARSEAIRRGQRVSVTAADGLSWNSGVVAGVDRNRNGAISAEEVLRQIEGAGGTLVLSGADVGFQSNGMTDATAPIQISICSGSGSGRRVAVSLGGRPEVQQLTCS